MIPAGKTYITYPSRTSELKITNFSDVHLGAGACDEKMLRRDILAVENDPNGLWVMTGDYGEFINFRDKRFDPASVAPWIDVDELAKVGQRINEKVFELFYPIRKKCLGIGIGNHEWSYSSRNDGGDRHDWLCCELGVRTLGYSSLQQLSFVRTSCSEPRITRESVRGFSCTTLKMFTHHGAGGAQTKGGKINRLKKFMDSFDADIYFVGHVHDKTGTRENVLTVDKDGTKIIRREKLGVVSGGYLKTYAPGAAGYGERAGYGPTTNGSAWVTIKPETRELAGQI
jgi:hypothetical protein